jgi:hypothetical protein
VAWQFQIKVVFPAGKQGLMLAQEHEICTYLNQLDVKNPLVLSVAQICA